MLIATLALLLVALVPLARLRRQEHYVGGPGTAASFDDVAAGMSRPQRPWAPVPLARGSHGAVVAPHHLATAAGLCDPARRRLGGRRGDRHERRRSASSCPAAAASAATRSG